MRATVALLSIALLAGCARVEVKTAVHADGSFDRTVAYKTQVSANGPTLGPAARASDYFDLPKATTGVKITQRQQKDEQIITATRSLPAGAAPLKDLTILETGKIVATNEASVRSVGDGKFEYSEVVHWVGPTQKSMLPPPALRIEIKKALPDGTTTAAIDSVVTSMSQSALHAMFGPPSPLLGDLVANQDLGARLLRQRLYVSFDKILSDAGSPPDRRAALLAKIMAQSLHTTLGDAADKTRTQPTQSSGGPVAMMFSVKAPGKVIETNGLTDPITGEVCWAMYPESASLGDVTIRVVYQP